MKRIAGLLVIVFSSALLLVAQDAAKTHEMTGWICNSKCVIQSTDKAACDKNCSETSGDVVFIDDRGTVNKIANQDMAMPHTGKRVKGKARMDKDQNNEDIMYFEQMVLYAGGGG